MKISVLIRRAVEATSLKMDESTRLPGRAPAFSTAFACGTWFAIGESDYICRAIK